eukprot:1183518-Rhodomonas_salina.3
MERMAYDARYWCSVWQTMPGTGRGMSGTDVVMSGTDIAMSGTDIAMSGTDVAYGGTRMTRVTWECSERRRIGA